MLIVFDWDGTLCDSTGRIVEAMQQAARGLGNQQPAADAVRDVIGLGLPEAMAKLFPELSRGDRDAMREHYSHCYRTLDDKPAGLFPGAMAVMDRLRARGHLLAVATGKGRRGLDRVLEGLAMGEYFDATRCADETSSKPNPRMLHELLAECRVEVSDCLMIGDSVYDLAMAAAAGMDSVGVSYGVHAPQRLMQHDPLAVIDELPQLLDLVPA
jgi:phosphoglycolate phosphatase